jgi:hypothetical protein
VLKKFVKEKHEKKEDKNLGAVLGMLEKYQPN